MSKWVTTTWEDLRNHISENNYKELTNESTEFQASNGGSVSTHSFEKRGEVKYKSSKRDKEAN